MKPFTFTKPQYFGVFTKDFVRSQLGLALRAHSELCKASDFVIRTEPVGFVLTKQVNDFLLRVQGKRNEVILWQLDIVVGFTGRKVSESEG